jgi:hypothetical protein
MPAILTSVMTTGPTFRLQLRLEQAPTEVDTEVEAEMPKSRFDAQELAPGDPVRLRPLEFGLFPEPGAPPALAAPLPETMPSAPRHAAMA